MNNLILFILFSGLAILAIYCIIDRFITCRNLSISQSEWDEYCKSHNLKTLLEKIAVYDAFCEHNKAKHGWQFFYFPKI